MKRRTQFLLVLVLILMIFMAFLGRVTPNERYQTQEAVHEETGLKIRANLYENATYLQITLKLTNLVINRTYLIRLELSDRFGFQETLNSSFVAEKETHLQVIAYQKPIHSPISLKGHWWYVGVYVDWRDSTET